MANLPQVPKQNALHRHSLAICAVFLTFCASSLPLQADSAAPARIGEQTSEMRLIAAGNNLRDFYHAGIEISLKQGALTYWRQPGDAGVPPVFSFEGSRNLAKAEVLYPAPSRIKEDEGEAFGYSGRVIFPLHLTPQDKTQPLVLKMTVDYAVCERICIPVKSQAEIILPLAMGISQDVAVAEAESRVPRRLSSSETDKKLTLVRENKSGNPAWRLIWKDPAPATDLFAETPEGWYFETKKTANPNEFVIAAVEMPKTPTGAPVPVTLTLTGPRQNYEFTLSLDPSSALR